MVMMNQEHPLNIAVSAARQAGELLRTRFRTGLVANHKATSIDLVTQADTESEALILGVLRRAFPDYGILAEEGGGNHAASDFTWLVDPLDGTTNFAHGYPQFSVSIALRCRDELVLGVVYDVMRDELYTAIRGQGATLNSQGIRVSGAPGLSHSLLVTGFPYDRQINPDNNLDHFGAFLLRAQGVLRLGSAALDLCAVAAGRLDGYWEFKLKPWDVAAGALMVTEAGGRISGCTGQPFNLEAGHIVASAPLIHAEMLAVLDGRAGGADLLA